MLNSVVYDVEFPDGTRRDYSANVIADVEFPDGTRRDYSANVIAENILTQVDSDGFSIAVMEGIIDYRQVLIWR